jgi:hypothetical protein
VLGIAALAIPAVATASPHSPGGSQKSVQISNVDQSGAAFSTSHHGWGSGAVVVNDNGTGQGSTQIATGSGSQSSLQVSNVDQKGIAVGGNAGVGNSNTTLQGSTQLLFGSAYGGGH